MSAHPRCTGWFVYELQIVALANVRGIPKAGLAAGAIWVQCESTMVRPSPPALPWRQLVCTRILN